MHEPIRDNLEEFLKGQQIPPEFHAHLAACEDCATQLQLLESQSKMLRSLRADQEVEPRPGFYARVMERIEAQRPASIWSILLEPRFGRRIAVASAVLALLLGTYLVSTEPGGSEFASTQQLNYTVEAPQAQVPAADALQQQRQRDAVLVNLASYHE